MIPNNGILLFVSARALARACVCVSVCVCVCVCGGGYGVCVIMCVYVCVGGVGGMYVWFSVCAHIACANGDRIMISYTLHVVNDV